KQPGAARFRIRPSAISAIRHDAAEQYAASGGSDDGRPAPVSAGGTSASGLAGAGSGNAGRSGAETASAAGATSAAGTRATYSADAKQSPRPHDDGVLTDGQTESSFAQRAGGSGVRHPEPAQISYAGSRSCGE